MKKEYVKPTLYAEMFAANEYVAACYHVYCKADQTCPHVSHLLIPNVTRNPTKPHYNEITIADTPEEAITNVVPNKYLTDNHKEHYYYHQSDNLEISKCDQHIINVTIADRPNASY